MAQQTAHTSAAAAALLVFGACAAVGSVNAAAGASISVSPALISDGDVVQVTWSNVAREHRGDPSKVSYL